MIPYVGAPQLPGLFGWERRLSGLVGEMSTPCPGSFHGNPSYPLDACVSGWGREVIGPVTKESASHTCLLSARLPTDPLLVLLVLLGVVRDPPI